jgi:hypothetical protein
MADQVDDDQAPAGETPADPCVRLATAVLRQAFWDATSPTVRPGPRHQVRGWIERADAFRFWCMVARLDATAVRQRIAARGWPQTPASEDGDEAAP